MLRLSIDERENDDIESEIDAIPFVINEDLADQYGRAFAIALDEHQAFDVQALNN
ncbi:MAG: hypothetical protein LBH94_06520 [Deltaproteobacteria bacterium]|nr:hypothetical protein [Deltaproteobacteria bacterium]